MRLNEKQWILVQEMSRIVHENPVRLSDKDFAIVRKVDTMIQDVDLQRRKENKRKADKRKANPNYCRSKKELQEREERKKNATKQSAVS